MPSRDRIFALAVNRALAYALKLDLLTKAEPEPLQQALELWYLKTRFVSRIPLEDIVASVKTYPGIACYWIGGKDGNWHIHKQAH